MSDPDPGSRLERAERKATHLFVGTSIVASITVGAMLVAGWGGGILDNRVEVLFWAGAILGAIGIGLLGVATIPTSRTATITALTRTGMLLFMIAPVMCIVAVFTDYWM